MELTQVRDDPVDPPGPHPAPARLRSAGWVLSAAVSMVAVQLGTRGWLIAQRHYYADDLRLLYLADRHALLSPSYLLQDYDGHLMPGGLLLAGLVERTAPLEWWPAAVTLVVLQAMASLALLRVLRVLLGDRPVLLVPLAFGLFTPITLGAVTWWAAALNSLPLQIGLAWYVSEAVLLARTGRRRHAVSGTVALALTLLFYLKAVLVPPVALAVVAILLRGDGVRSPVAAAVRRARPLWAGTAGVLAVWVVAYAATRDRNPVGAGGPGAVWATVSSGYEALTPAVLGGPFGWRLVPPGTPLADPAPWLVTLGALVLLAALLWTCARLRGAPAVWALAVVSVGAGLLVAALGRSGLALGEVAPFAYRYFAADAVLLAIAGALLATLPRRRGTAGGRPPSHRPGATVVIAAATAWFVAAGVVSTIGHARAWEGDRVGQYLDAARTSLASAGPAALLDQSVPADVMWPLSFPSTLASRVFAPLPDRPRFAAATGELRILDDTGHLVPATLEPAARALAGPDPGCGYPVGLWHPSTSLPLEGPLLAGEWTVQLWHTAAGDGVLSVALDDGDPVEVPVVAGTSTSFVRLTGPASAIRVDRATDGLEVCVYGAYVGRPVS